MKLKIAAALVFSTSIILSGCNGDSKSESAKKVHIPEYTSPLPSSPIYFAKKSTTDDTQQRFGVSQYDVRRAINALPALHTAYALTQIKDSSEVTQASVRRIGAQIELELEEKIEKGINLKEIDEERHKLYHLVRAYKINPLSEADLSIAVHIADYFKNKFPGYDENDPQRILTDKHLLPIYQQLFDNGLIPYVPESYHVFNSEYLRYLGGMSFDDIFNGKLNLSEAGKRYNQEAITVFEEKVAFEKAANQLAADKLSQFNPEQFNEEFEQLLSQARQQRTDPSSSMTIRLITLKYESSSRDYNNLVAELAEELKANQNMDISSYLDRGNNIAQRIRSSIQELKKL